MKSLEHIIREIREGKFKSENKKDSLEHAIRKVGRKEYESSFAAKDSKPVDEGTDHSVYHVSWGPGLDHEVVAKHDEEAISKAKDALVAKTPKLKDPKYSDTFNKKPTVHNISKERNVQKEDVGGLIGSGTGGEPKLHAEDGKKKKTDEAVGSIGTDKFQGNQFKSVRTVTPHIAPPGPSHGHSQAPENVSRQRTLAKEKISMTMHGKVTEENQLDEFQVKMPTPTKVAEPITKAATKAVTKAAVGRAVGVALGPEAMVAQAIAPEIAAKYQQQHKSMVPHAETPGVSATTSFERMKGFKVAPPKPAETKPQVKPEEKTKVTPAAEPAPKTEPKVAPATAPETKTEVTPKAVVLPKIDVPAETKPATEITPKSAPAETTPKAAETTTTTPEEGKKKFPTFGAMAFPDVFGAQRGIASKHPVASKARGARRHVSEEVADKIRKKIQNMPRPDAGDRKSIEYVGRSDAEPKTSKEKTLRLATIKNVIDEAKKIKIQAEDGKEKKFVYPNDTEVVIEPNMKRNFLDVEDKKLPKDYENK